MKIEDLYHIYLNHPNIQTDTRKLQKGDFYCALKGERFNGNEFAQQALNAGASMALVDEEKYCVNEQCILVDDVLKSLQDLALHHRRQFKIPFIAITGSNGKTTTKELIHAVLSRRYKTYATEGNLNNHIGVPLTLLKIRSDAEMAIIEMGANHQQEIAFYCGIAEPDYAIINNCGKAHLEGFGGEEGVRKGKGELYDFIRAQQGCIFRNVDLDYLQTMSQGIERQITYGTQLADYTGIAEIQNDKLWVHITSPGMECSIPTHLVGDYNFGNVMAAVAVGRYFKVPIQEIQVAITSYTPNNSRSQQIQQGTNTIILDAYNANPSSMKAALDNFVRLDYPNKVVMLGAMMELGEESIPEHQQIIKQLTQNNWNEVVLVGGDFKSCTHPYHYFDTAEQASNWLSGKGFEQTCILIKGSRAMAMEKVLG